MEYTVGRGLCSDTKASVSTFLVDMPSATPSEKNARSCAEPGQERSGDKVVAPPGTLLSIITQPLLYVNTSCAGACRNALGAEVGTTTSPYLPGGLLDDTDPPHPPIFSANVETKPELCAYLLVEVDYPVSRTWRSRTPSCFELNHVKSLVDALWARNARRCGCLENHHRAVARYHDDCPLLPIP